MATTNDRNIIIRLSNDSKHLEDQKILTEAYENCDHNNSKSFIHSIMNIDYKGDEDGDEESEESDRYMTFCYQKKFQKNIIKNLLELENSNSKRTQTGIATKGIGMKHVFHKYAKTIEILSLDEKALDFYYKFNLEEHVNELKKNKDINVNDSFSTRSYQIEDEKSLSKFFRSHYEIKTIYQTLNAEINNYNEINTDEKKIEKHRGYIILKLNEQYNNFGNDELNSIIEEFKKICGIKFFNKFDSIPYYFHQKLGNFNNFEKIKKKDVLFYQDSFDKFTWYIKILKITQKREDFIAYFKNKSKYYYYKYTLNTPKPGKFTPITDKDEIYIECKKLNSKNCDHSYEYYNIGNNNKIKLASEIESESIEKYTGFYYLLDDIILNDKPQDVSEILESQSRNNPGRSMARHVLKIKNKQAHDIRGIKSEYTLKGEKNKKILKDLCKIMNEVNNNKWKDKTYIFQNKFVDSSIILSHLEQLSENNKSTKKKITKNNNRDDFTKIYLTLYKIPQNNTDYDTDIYEYLFKVGYTSQNINSRSKQNAKKINLPEISQTFFNMERNLAQKTEIDLLSYLREKRSNDFKNILEKGRITERFYCHLDDFKNLEDLINNFKYLLLTQKISNWTDFQSS